MKKAGQRRRVRKGKGKKRSSLGQRVKFVTNGGRREGGGVAIKANRSGIASCGKRQGEGHRRANNRSSLKNRRKKGQTVLHDAGKMGSKDHSCKREEGLDSDNRACKSTREGESNYMITRLENEESGLSNQKKSR